MPLGYTEEEVKKLKINKFQTLADFQAAQNAHLIGDDEISMIEEIMHPDWNQNNPSAPDYIENKPNIPPFLPTYGSGDGGYVLTVNASGTGVDWEPTQATPNVQADWNESDTGSDAYIQNKPTIPAAQVQSDWDATSGMGVILNKPTLVTITSKRWTNS